MSLTYDVDWIGALSSISTPNSSTTYTHDGFGRLATSIQTTTGIPYPFTYTYSLTDQLTGVTYPSGRSVTYALDSAGRLSGVSGGALGQSTPTAYASSFAYTAAQALSSMALGNNVTESHNWNDRLQHTGMSVGNLLSLNFYPCDQGQITCNNNNGNIWRQTINVNNGAAQAAQEYRYDALNRLTMAEEKTAAGFTPTCPDTTGVWTQQNTFDPAGNRTAGCRGGLSTMTGEVAAFNPANNRITDSGWSYDAAGNITTGWMGLTLAYDAENRQVAACTVDQTCVNQAGTGRTLYIYDGAGQRVQKQTTSGPTTYVYDAFGNLAAEYGGNPVESGTQYIAVDHLGSTRLVMEGTQATERHDYLPFGYELSGGWRTAGLGYGVNTVRQKFTGQERDAESGMDFFQARYFNGPQGRFASVDPGNAGASLTDPQSWNGYAYVGNSPLTYTDPSGEFLAAAAGAALGLSNPVGWAIDAVDLGVTLWDLFGGGGSKPDLSSVAWTPGPVQPLTGGADPDPYAAQAADDDAGSVGPGALFGGGNTGPFVSSAMPSATWPGSWPGTLPGLTGISWWNTALRAAAKAIPLLSTPLRVGMILVVNPRPAGNRNEWASVGLCQYGQQCPGVIFSKGGKQNVGHAWTVQEATSRYPTVKDPCAALKKLMDDARKSGDSKTFLAAKATWKQMCREN